MASSAAALPVDLDGDGRPETQLAWEGEGRVTVAEAAGKRLVLVRDATRGYLGLWNGAALEELWRGALGPQGVDGEWRREVELGDDGALLYETRPDVARCDGQPARIYPQRFDLAARRFRPISLVPELPARALAAVRAAPAGLDDKTRPSVFRFEAATVTADDGGSAEGLSAPRELDDGRRDTAWSEAQAGFGRGTVFVARAETPRARVAALRVVGGDGTRGTSRPRRLLISAARERWLFELPDVATPVWLVFPTPVQASCVDVVLESVHAHGGRTAIAELAVLTDLDAGGDRALAELALAAGRGDLDAEHHLAARKGAGAGAIVAAIRSGASGAELRNLRLALARMADPSGAAEVAAGLAAAEKPEDLRTFEEGLAAMREAAVPALAKLLGDETAPVPARERAARVLGAAAAVPAREALLAASGRGPPSLRRAVIVGLAGRPPAEAPAVLAAARGGHPDVWRAAALQGRRAPEARAAVVAAAEEALAAAPAPQLRYRLLQALALLSPGPALERALAAEPDAALRQAAVATLDGEAATPFLVRALDDVDPGVRVTAAAALAARPAVTAADAPLLSRLASDGWPSVRRAAAEALAVRCARAADGLLAAARDDEDENVVRATLAGLVRCHEPRIGPTLVAIARDETASPALRAYAASLLGPLGDRARVPDLVALLGDARTEALAAPDAVAADGALRLATAAAHALGMIDDARGARALLDAAADGTFPVVQAAALTALARRCPPGARPVIERAEGSDDALVTRAVRLAMERCAAP